MKTFAFAVVMALAATACSSSDGGSTGAPDPTSTTDASFPTTTSAAPAPPPDAGVFVVGRGGTPLLDGPSGAETGRIRAGVLLPYDERTDDFAHVTTPCENRAWVPLDAGEARGPFRVVIDPGHGGEEPGATGPTGLTEAEVNLDISDRVVALLAMSGISATVTRTQDYRATLAFRVQVAIDSGAEVFVSVHHNAAPDEERDTPGSETYYQFRSDESKRLTGLVYEEIFRTFSQYHVTFGADLDAGAKYRLSDSGRDYYGLIRRTFEADIAATLSEGAFISNPEEEALLRRQDVRNAEAEAIATAIERYFAGDQPGDVFTDPYPRETPAGGGGGRSGCEDPA